MSHISNNKKIAKRYANALYELALENNELEAVYKDINNIHIAFFDDNMSSDNKEILKIINSKLAFQKDLSEVFKKICDKVSAVNITKNFLNIIINSQRISILCLICQEFIALYKKHKKIESVNVVFAHQISDAMREQVIGQMKNRFGNNSDIKIKYNKKILAGVVVEHGSHRYDASLRNKLASIKRNLLESHLA